MRPSRALLMAVTAGTLAASLAACSGSAAGTATDAGVGASTSPARSGAVPTASVTQAGVGALTPSTGSGHDDEVKVFDDPAVGPATATVPGPSPRIGVVASLPVAAIPAVAGYSYAADVPVDPMKDPAVFSRAAYFSGAVSRSVRGDGGAVGWVTVYRLTEQAGSDPTTDSLLVPAMLGRFSGQDLPVPSSIGGQRVLRVESKGTQAVAWHAGERLFVVWGGSGEPDVMAYVRKMIGT